jgi:hypothetical protein
LDPSSLDAVAIERILDAVGEKFIPPGLDKQTLLLGLAISVPGRRNAAPKLSRGVEWSLVR